MEDKGVGGKILKGTIVIVLVGILAKCTSFISEAILAAYLGTNATSDAYYMISGVHQVVYPMLGIGVWKVFLPLYKKHITLGQIEEARALANRAITFFTLISAAVVLLIVIFAGPVVSVVAPGFQGETKELCITLVRIASPMFIFIIASAVYAAMLQCHNKFLGSQIREVASHIPTILAAVLLYHRFGIKIMAAALVVGGGVRLLIELPFVSWGYHYRPDHHFRTPEFSQMLRKLPAALLMEGAVKLNTLIDKAMGSTLPAGTISGMNYGQKLVNVFSGLLSTAVSTALYPQMVELIALQKREELSRVVAKILNIFCLLMLPVTFACVLFRTELVSAVYQRGNFTADSVAMTAGVFAFYILAIYFTAGSSVLNNLFYGNGDTRTPMFISIGALVFNVGLNLALIGPMGVNGLALATSLTSIVSYFVRLLVVRKYLDLPWKPMCAAALKALAASALSCFGPWLLLRQFALNKYWTLLIAALLGVGLYLLCLYLLRVKELGEILTLLRKKLKKKSQSKQDFQ